MTIQPHAEVMAWYLLLMVLFSVILECAGETVDVETGLGTVRGDNEDFQGTPLQIFKSIPFAQPPVGDLRFKAPQSVEAWDDVLDVTQSPDSCIQTADEAFGEFPGDYKAARLCMMCVCCICVGGGERMCACGGWEKWESSVGNGLTSFVVLGTS